MDVIGDLRAHHGMRVAILGSHQIPAGRIAKALDQQWSTIVELLGFEPSMIVTGDADVGAEKAARLVAKKVTGKLATVFHRATTVYPLLQAEAVRDAILAQHTEALLVLGKKCCKQARKHFHRYKRSVYEIEIN